MTLSTTPFTIGFEEEYFLVDPVTRDLATGVQKAVIEDCTGSLDSEVGGIVPEFLRSQVEVGTSVCRSMAEAREKLSALRRAVAVAARNNGVEPLAASTHPIADWHRQDHTDKQYLAAEHKSEVLVEVHISQSVAQTLISNDFEHHQKLGSASSQDNRNIGAAILSILSHP